MRLQSGLMVVDTHGMDSSTAAGRSTWRSLLSALQAQRCGVAPVQTHADAVAPADIMQGTVVHIANQRTSVFVRHGVGCVLTCGAGCARPVRAVRGCRWWR